MTPKKKFPDKIFDKFKQAGLFAAMYDEVWGGLGLGGYVETLLAEVVSDIIKESTHHE